MWIPTFIIIPFKVFGKYPFSTIYSVARKLKKGSNSFNSNPYSALWDLIKNDVEKASINIPITNT